MKKKDVSLDTASVQTSPFRFQVMFAKRPCHEKEFREEEYGCVGLCARLCKVACLNLLLVGVFLFDKFRFLMLVLFVQTRNLKAC